MRKQTRNDLLALSAEVIKLQRQLESVVVMTAGTNHGYEQTLKRNFSPVAIGLSGLANSIQNLAVREEAS